MAGVDSLTKTILLDAEEKAEGILLDARERAAKVVEAAKEEAEKEAALSAQKAEEDAAEYAQRIRSQIGMQKRQALLKAKQDLIESYIEKAKEVLLSQDKDAYFAMLLGILEKHVRNAQGELLLSPEDFNRKPADFDQKVSAAAAKQGGSLTVLPQKGEGTKVLNGFVLRYGGIEENCTLDALFQDKNEDLRDACSRVLFAEDKA